MSYIAKASSAGQMQAELGSGKMAVAIGMVAVERWVELFLQ